MNELRELQIPIPGMDPNIIETKNHTLIIEDIPDKFDPMDVDGPDGEKLDIYERTPGGRLYKLYLGDFDARGSENHKMYDKLRSAEPTDQLEIHVSSDGGNFYEIVEFYNLLKPKFAGIATFINRGYSAGSMAFLIGNERIVYEHSDFMVHSYIGGSYGKREDMLNQAIHTDKMITDFFEKVYKPYFSKKEMKKINKGKDFWMDSVEMLKRGIATGIVTDDGEYLTRDEYLEKIPGYLEEQEELLEYKLFKEKEKKKKEKKRKREEKKDLKKLEKILGES